jgi:methyl-accepting chemotaxis protein
MFSRMTIRARLVGGFATLLACLLGLGYFSLSAVDSLRGDLDEMANRTARKIQLVGEINASAAGVRAENRALLLAAVLKHDKDLEAARKNFHKYLALAGQQVRDLRPLLTSEAETRATDELERGLPAWQATIEEMDRLATAGDIEAADRSRIDKQRPVADQLTKSAAEILRINREFLVAATLSASGHATRNHRLVVGCTVVGFLVGALMLFVVHLVNTSLRQSAAELAEGAERVAGAAGQVSQSSQSLAQGATEQAASLEETSASSEEIHSIARHSAENTLHAAGLVTASQQKFGQTKAALEEMVVAMDDINSESGKIAKIIKVIDGIAFQTNILALNAAVEAARAGEAGMGFAVVADEVRNLAQRSAQAARDTAGLIEESIRKATNGKIKVDQVAASIRLITTEFDQVKRLVDEVNRGSQEQSIGFEQVAKAILQMQQVTQVTAAGAQEGAASAAQLNAHSAKLRGVVDRLTAMVEGG